jgi:von Willebrand factor type A domain.
MAVKDTRTGRSRLDNAKEVIDQLVSKLDGETVALYTFTSEADKLVPSTTDYIYLRLLMRNLEVNHGDTVGTDIHKAVKSVLDDYRDLPSQAFKYIILLSDGGDTSLDGLSKEEIKRSVEQMTTGIAGLAKEHWKIYSVGVGSAKGGAVPDVVFQGKPVQSALEPVLLQALAAKGGGSYDMLDTTTASALAEKWAKIINDDSPFLSPHEVAAPGTAKESITVIYDSFYRYPLLIAILALLGALFFPDRIERMRQR